MHIDPSNYPSAADYLSRLPNGLQSYPQCVCKSDVFSDMPVALASVKDDPSLPPEISRFLGGETTGTWMPEVWAVTLLHIANDALFITEQQMMDWELARVQGVYDRPLYRSVIRVFSTSLLVMGAADRWRVFRQGSILSTERIVDSDGRCYCNAILSFPDNLFDILSLKVICVWFSAAMEAVRPSDSKVELIKRTCTEAVFRLSWKS